jgi:plasmid stabilization system protein ParE
MGTPASKIAGTEKEASVSGYSISPAAEADLVEIWEYIAQDDFDAADAWIRRLRDAIESLAHNPGMGHTRKDLTDHDVLFWPVGAYLILYRVKNKMIEITAVTHGARDIPSFLIEREQWNKRD